MNAKTKVFQIGPETALTSSLLWRIVETVLGELADWGEGPLAPVSIIRAPCVRLRCAVRFRTAILSRMTQCEQEDSFLYLPHLLFGARCLRLSLICGIFSAILPGTENSP